VTFGKWSEAEGCAQENREVGFTVAGGVDRGSFRRYSGKDGVLTHTSIARAGASERLDDEYFLRSINEALPLSGSSQSLLGSELLDENHDAAALWTKPCADSLRYRSVLRYGAWGQRGSEQAFGKRQTFAAAAIR